MQALGYLLITAGFLAGSYFSVVDAEVIAWPFYGLALVAGIAGVAIARLAQRGAARNEGRLSSNITTLEASLGRLVVNAGKLERDRESIGVYDLRHHVEKDFASDIDAFVEARQSIAHCHGLQAYADVMSHFASAERHLNRVWSTSTDGYIDEAHTYITKAKEQFEETAAELRKLTAARGDSE